MDAGWREAERAWRASPTDQELLARAIEASLRSAGGVDDDFLAVLAEWPRLESLSVAGTGKVTGAFLGGLARAGVPLRTLSLEATSVDDAGLRLAAQLPLEELDLTRARGFGDDGLRALQAIPTLRSLRLDCCDPLTDEGLRSLAEFPALQRLYLRGSKTWVKETRGARDHLAEALVDCKIFG